MVGDRPRGHVWTVDRDERHEAAAECVKQPSGRQGAPLPFPKRLLLDGADCAASAVVHNYAVRRPVLSTVPPFRPAKHLPKCPVRAVAQSMSGRRLKEARGEKCEAAPAWTLAMGPPAPDRACSAAISILPIRNKGGATTWLR